jgi:hypothetical protein
MHHAHVNAHKIAPDHGHCQRLAIDIFVERLFAATGTLYSVGETAKGLSSPDVFAVNLKAGHAISGRSAAIADFDRHGSVLREYFHKK